MEIRISDKYVNTEILGGLFLFVAAALAMLLMNSPYKEYYETFINYRIGFSVGELHFNKSLLFWVNDGLISFFFFLIGLEIKRELCEGQLSDKAELILPFTAAIAGMLMPAIIYTAFNYQNAINMRGWAIPTAMDTAFSLGLLSLLGKHIPRSLRIFLMSLAIIDDILAVLIIAIFYANELSQFSTLATIFMVGILVLLNQMGVKRAFPYLAFGLLLWIFVLQSGVHTSIAGVILAFTIPLEKTKKGKSLLLTLEENLHPWVAFAIIPLFAFTNAGIPISAFSFENLLSPLALGIILGLFIGKQCGVFMVTWALVKLGRVNLPEGVSWLQMYGASVLCGIGFTMSLFIGALSFESGGPQYNDIVKSSVFVGSILSAILGVIILLIKPPPKI
jgi:NhaA family Na+:H+ antiporter